MTMVKRDDVSEQQIREAKVMPGANADQSDDRNIVDTPDDIAAEQPVQGIPGAPGRLPGYKK